MFRKKEPKLDAELVCDWVRKGGHELILQIDRYHDPVRYSLEVIKAYTNDLIIVGKGLSEFEAYANLWQNIIRYENQPPAGRFVVIKGKR